MHITNTVSAGSMNTTLNLGRIARDNINIVYNPRKFTAATWRHRQINGSLVLFPNGKFIHLGRPVGSSPRIHIRRFARILQKQGYLVHLGPIRLVCMSAVHKLSGKIDLHAIPRYLCGTYESEILNAGILKHGSVTACVFHTGTVVLTGLRSVNSVYPLILELELFTQ
jgi:TATA-box binding protein (TBP) (component of TFIID and TFIIIB)